MGFMNGVEGEERSVEVQAYIDLLDEMLLNEDYDFATDTLVGIRDWVSDNNHITEKQIVAIQNIRGSVDRYEIH